MWRISVFKEILVACGVALKLLDQVVLSCHKFNLLCILLAKHLLIPISVRTVTQILFMILFHAWFSPRALIRNVLLTGRNVRSKGQLRIFRSRLLVWFCVWRFRSRGWNWSSCWSWSKRILLLGVNLLENENKFAKTPKIGALQIVVQGSELNINVDLIIRQINLVQVLLKLACDSLRAQICLKSEQK